jgi:hypothetical protein
VKIVGFFFFKYLNKVLVIFFVMQYLKELENQCGKFDVLINQREIAYS